MAKRTNFFYTKYLNESDNKLLNYIMNNHRQKGYAVYHKLYIEFVRAAGYGELDSKIDIEHLSKVAKVSRDTVTSVLKTIAKYSNSDTTVTHFCQLVKLYAHYVPEMIDFPKYNKSKNNTNTYELIKEEVVEDKNENSAPPASSEIEGKLKAEGEFSESYIQEHLPEQLEYFKDKNLSEEMLLMKCRKGLERLRNVCGVKDKMYLDPRMAELIKFSGGSVDD